MLTIVVPVYNEHESIERLLRSLEEKISTPFQVMIVYDVDDDTTIPVVKSVTEQLRYNLILQKNIFGRGALNAIKTGLLLADTDAILVTMADSSDDLSDVDQMYNLFQAGYDVVCGSRYMKGGRQIGGPQFKRMLSRLAGISLHWLSGIPTHDVTNSFKLYRRTLIHSITIESTGGFEIGMEITVKAFKGGFRIAEVPTTWVDRANGQSNFKLWRWLPSYMKWYLYGLFGRTSPIQPADIPSKLSG